MREATDNVLVGHLTGSGAVALALLFADPTADDAVGLLIAAFRSYGLLYVCSASTAGRSER